MCLKLNKDRARFRYNNAAGDPDITIFTDALVSHDGLVFWAPPSIYKSFCAIDISWFPFDAQECDMKVGPQISFLFTLLVQFGAWSYTGYYVDLRQIDMSSPNKEPSETLENGMDLSFFYKWVIR